MTEGGAGAGPAAGLRAGRGHAGGAGLSPGPLARVLAAVAGPVVSAQTWLAVIHLTAGVVTGALAFGVIVALALAGIGTLWLFLIGLPVLVAALWLSLQFGRAERARFLVMLGMHVPAASLPLSPDRGRWRRMWRLLTARVAWRHAGYALIRLPLSLTEMIIVTAVWSFALAMLGLPLFGWLLIRLQWHVNAGVPHPLTVALAVLLGLVVLPVAPRVTLALAAADTAVARYLIGPGSQADMSKRIGELESSRARAVGRRRPAGTGAGRPGRPALRGGRAAVGAQPGRRPDRDRGGAAMRVVIAEDSVLLREGLTRLLAEAGHDVAAAAGEAEEFLRAVGAYEPDVVVVDVRMPPTFTDEGLRAALVVRQRWPGVGVLVLSQYVEERYATELLSDRPHGVGYLLKDRVADLAEFLDALDRVAAGGSALDPEVVAQLLARSRHPLADLTAREREVLALMAEGRSNAAIAAALVVSEGARSWSAGTSAELRPAGLQLPLHRSRAGA